MILSEIKKVGLPVMGLISSDSSLEIDYPLFAHDQSYTSVYFFCHFLASLIAKEMAYTQHKHYILQKPSPSKKKSRSKPRALPYLLKNFFFFRSFLRPKNKFNKRRRAQNKMKH
jgi:ribosomal protein S2